MQFRGWKALLDDESGQGTTEYILILSVTVAIASGVLQLLRPILLTIRDRLTQTIQNSFFTSGDSLHQLRLRR